MLCDRRKSLSTASNTKRHSQKENGKVATAAQKPEASPEEKPKPSEAEAAVKEAAKYTPQNGEEPDSAAPVVRISTKKQRPTVEIDGKFYELKLIGDFGIGQQQILNRDGREFYTLWTSEDELDEDQQKRLKMLLERMFAKVLDAPKSVLRKLDDADKSDVVLNFTLAPLRKAMLEANATAQTEEQTQESPSTTTS